MKSGKTQRARIELVVRELDYDYFLTKVHTGRYLANFAYFWHAVIAYIQYSFLRGIFYKVNGQPEPLLLCERDYLTFLEGWSTVLGEWLWE